MNNFPNINFAQETPSSDGIAECRIPAWKRGLDITCVLVSAIGWLPAGLLVGIFIKIVSPGPLIFRQPRIGFMGKRFWCLKFRTMAVNADAGVHERHLELLMNSSQPMKKLDDAGDARIIPGGSWLRALGIDELPQLINVLRGEMSLVGPRPSVVYEHERYQAIHRRRCETLPGLTGLWQVSGKNQTSFEKMMELDLAYVKKQSLCVDIKILLGTLPALLAQVWNTKKRPLTVVNFAPATFDAQDRSKRDEYKPAPDIDRLDAA